MVYVIAVYDMKSGRTERARKFLQQYLTHVQQSVFEGDVTAGQADEIERKLDEMASGEESAIVYRVSTESYVDRTVVGTDPREDHQFID